MNTETNVNQQPVQQSNLQQLNQEHERGVAQDPALPMLLPARVDQVHILMLPVSVLQSDANQPRKHFDEAEIDSLAASIRAHGLINPITVRRAENNVFYVVAGERRRRAAVKAGLTVVPCIEQYVCNYAELSLTENFVRADLSAIEKAEALRQLITEGATLKGLSARFGCRQNTLTEIIGLTRLSPVIKNQCRYDRSFATRELKKIATISDEAVQMDMFKKYLKKKSINLRLKAARDANEGESILKVARMLAKLLESPEPIHDDEIHRAVCKELNRVHDLIKEAISFYGDIN
jgi:ParB/RepB/Spo0J family partition protein